VARTFLFGAILAAIAPACAFAQSASVPEGVGVADRQRPDNSPIGGRLGSFFLYPVVDVKIDATDNVRATTTGRLSDLDLSLGGRARLRSNFSRHVLNLEAYAGRSFHTNVVTENVTRYGGKIDGVYDISSATKLSAQILADHGAEARSSYNSPLNARSPGRFNRLNSALTLQQKFGNLDISGKFGYTVINYSNVQLFDGSIFNQEYRKSKVYAGTLTAGYMFRPGISVIARGTADKVDYSLAASDPLQPGNFNRDSNGLRVEAGFRFELTSLLYGDVRAGYFKRDYSDPRLQGTSGVSFGGDLLFNVSALTTLRASADRRVDEAASTTIGGNRTTELQLSIDHELFRNVVLSANLRHLDIVPLGPLQSSKEFYAGAGGRWQFSRQLSLHLGYRRAQRRSPGIGRAFRENLGTADVQLTF